MADKVLLVVENLAVLDSVYPHLPKDWHAVTPFHAMPYRGFNVVVVPKDIVEGRFRSTDYSAAVREWYQQAVLTSLAPGCRVLKT